MCRIPHKHRSPSGTQAPEPVGDASTEPVGDASTEPAEALVSATEPATRHTGRDLALNRPGHSLVRKIAEDRQSQSRLWSLLLDLTGASRRDPWYLGLVGERVVGKELDRLVRKDPRWRVLHSVPDPVDRFNPDKDIDHLVIGPNGVFTINTKHHRGKAVWVGRTHGGTGPGSPIVDRARAEARRASTTLTNATGIHVAAQPMLVFVGAASITAKETDPDAPVPALTPRGLVTWLQDHSGREVREFDVDTLYAHARRESTWTGALPA
ncbi:nuclease-related domain-containing protein [Antribacter gilvus]|uniref:nuclease-related domain-containing protein n=1 Tax=Antribacter gilvus TaxID=2304675 RepID=UPI001980D985|nr:nuclease-related domain-containing protein [Antribacter gilvus]